MSETTTVGTTAAAAQRRTRLLRDPVVSIVALFVVLQAICIVASLADPESFRYVSSTNIGLLMRSIPVLGITALGVGALMITGEFDLSVGSVYALAAYSLALLVLGGVPIWIAVLCTMAIGAAIGAVNGLITVRAAIPSFITTMGTMLVVRGLVRFLSEGRTVSLKADPLFKAMTTGTVLGIEAPFIWFIVIALVFAALIHRSKLGNHMFLTGGSEKTALAVGIDAHRVKVIAFALSGLTASIAGILSIARVSTATPAQGLGMELKAVAICVIGGLFLAGGRGTVLGIVVGSCLLYMVEDVLLLLRAPGFYIDVFVGAILIVAVILNTWFAKKRGK